MLREGRIKKNMDPKALRLTSSIESDRNIFNYDILVDVAHVLTLRKGGYLSDNEAKEILSALKEVKKSGFKDDWPYEDVHEAIEAEVTKITPLGAKMHTGRSRNDEVATCLRMFARDHLLNLAESVLNALEILLKKAERSHFLMPGFTHLQYAQPTRLSHHLVAYHDMLSRDFERIVETFRRVNKSPLGSAAFASTCYSLDRLYSARLLGFDGVLENSEDAVSSRDFIIESIFVSASTMLSISRIAEEIILFSSEFGFIILPDEYSSTSSIMPQKKNPDVAEILRANSGRIAGNLMSAMMIYKAMPFSYNRDFQEMNPLLYESLKKSSLAVEVFASMMDSIKFNEAIMREKATKGFATATELADILVIKYGVPFRMAHRIVGKLAARGIEKPSVEEIDTAAGELGIKIKVKEDDLLEALNAEKVVENRKNIGGTSRAEVERMIKSRKEELRNKKTLLRKLRGEVVMGLKMLYEEASKLGVNINA